MDLYIRSQNKERLIKVNNKVSINEVGIFFVDDKQIATYKTKSRALEVLDEIQMFIDGEIVETRETTQLVFPRNTNVYEMPEK